MNGHVITTNGHVITTNGRLIATNGRVIKMNGHATTTNGHVITTNGHVITTNGRVIKMNGHVITTNGLVIKIVPIKIIMETTIQSKANFLSIIHSTKPRPPHFVLGQNRKWFGGRILRKRTSWR
jgi:uncharacterized Zn-binding protein involved in type VI secretion